MKKTGSRFLNFLALAGLMLLLSACGGGGGDSAAGSGSLSLGLTDGPVDDLEQVVVTFTEVIVHPAGGGQDLVFDMTEGGTTSGVSVDLKTLTQGNSIRLLEDEPLPAGNYSWIRLVINPDETYVVDLSGAELLLDCSSCDESHLKLNRSFKISAAGLVDFTIDFDLRKSITLQQPNKVPYEDYQYKLRPTLRIIETQVASAYISGTVDQALVDPAPSPATLPDACAVYVYTGDEATVDPDDICINDQYPAACPQADRPLTTADVALDTNTGLYAYQTGYLYPGTYTVALLCEEDVADADDNVTFLGEAQVDAVAGDNVHDFTAPVGP
jgi:hypothetical protein